MPPRRTMQIPPSNVVHLTRGGSNLQSETGPITAPQLVHDGILDLPDSSSGISNVYIHIPFCFHKCHYCDFYSIVDSRDRQGEFTDRLIAEMAAAAELVAFRSVRTIFVGGGTPTLLAVPHWQRLLEAVATYLQPQSDCEFTVEANPETVTPELAATLTAGGVNRVSIGAQSFNSEHLKTLERWHDPANVARSIQFFRNAGVKAINLDLIFAIPGQSLDDWLADLDTAIALEPSHLSCYGLTYEPNTPMTAKLRLGRFQAADQETEAAMYCATADRLAAEGFEHYEVSAWSRPGCQCQHNLCYWTNSNWWPIGPSASGHVKGTRWKNVPRLGSYLASGPGLPPVVDVERVDADARVGETLMLSLRLIDGIALAELQQLLALGTRGRERTEAIDRYVAEGLLDASADRLRFTRAGMLLADSVLADLI